MANGWHVCLLILAFIPSSFPLPSKEKARENLPHFVIQVVWLIQLSFSLPLVSLPPFLTLSVGLWVSLSTGVIEKGTNLHTCIHWCVHPSFSSPSFHTICLNDTSRLHHPLLAQTKLWTGTFLGRRNETHSFVHSPFQEGGITKNQRRRVKRFSFFGAPLSTSRVQGGYGWHVCPRTFFIFAGIPLSFDHRSFLKEGINGSQAFNSVCTFFLTLVISFPNCQQIKREAEQTHAHTHTQITQCVGMTFNPPPCGSSHFSLSHKKCLVS